MKRLRAFVVIAVGLVLLVGCAKGGGSPDPTPEPTPEPKTATVEILPGAFTYDDDLSNDYSPNTLHVEVGTTVTWVNNDSVWHTVDTHDGVLDSGQIDPGKSWSYTFDREGVYEYHCHPHPWMTGKVIVGDVPDDGSDQHGDGHDDGHKDEHEDEREHHEK